MSTPDETKRVPLFGKNKLLIALLAFFSLFLLRQSNLVQNSDSIVRDSVKNNEGSQEAITVEVAVTDKEQHPLPDWRVLTDCSAYNTDCATFAMIQNKYKEYPFQFNEQTYHKYQWEELNTLPQNWTTSLQEHATKRSLNVKDYYVYPPEKTATESAKCMKLAETTPFEEQIDLVLKQLGRAPELDDMVSFTISDYKYAVDMLHEVFEMAWDVVGFPNAFFMVALDRPTVEMACKYGYPIVVWPGALSPTEELVHKVANSKFKMSQQLVQRDQDFFFFEMDVFFIKSPKPYLVKNQTFDILVASHQNNPGAPNIGVYGVRANDATREFFDFCLEWTALSPTTHDQWAFSEVWWVSERVKNKQLPQFSNQWNPTPPTPNYQHHVVLKLFGPHHVVSSEWIIPTEYTIAVHPLCGAPLLNPHGKKIIAKEMGAWYGFRGPAGQAGYYQRTREFRRFLMLDGRVLGGHSLSERDFYHREDNLRFHIVIAVCLARRTNRILILPKVIVDRGVYFLWTMLDLQSLEGLVEVRETNYLSNPKSWFTTKEPFQSVARTALGGDGRLFAELPSTSSSTGIVVKTWKVPDSFPTQLDAFCAVATAVPEIQNAEALFINPRFSLPGHMNGLKARYSEEKKLTKVEEEIMWVYKKLKWCNRQGIVLENVASISRSAWDCYGKGKSMIE